MAKMRDGIVKRGSKWWYVLELPRDPVTGKRRQKWIGGFRTRKEAKDDRDEARARLKSSTWVAPTKQTVGEYLHEWLAGARGHYAPGAWDAARSHIELYIIPTEVEIAGARIPVGDLPLAALTTPIVKALYEEVRVNGRKRQRRICVRCGRRVLAKDRKCKACGELEYRLEREPLEAKTVHNIHRTLSRALNDACDEIPPRIPANPAAKAHRQPSSPEQPTWTAAQLREFYAAIAGDRQLALWRLAATTGMRRGELAGLRWVDVDLDRGALALRVQLAKGHGGVVERELKGKRGRQLPLDPATTAMLRAHRTRQLEERMRWGTAWQDDGLSRDRVFRHPDGRWLHPDSITKRLARIVRDAGLPWIKLHGLRHTHATHMLEAGEHIKIVQERLGHSSIAITGDTYSHVSATLQEAAAARVAELVDGHADAATTTRTYGDVMDAGGE